MVSHDITVQEKVGRYLNFAQIINIAVLLFIQYIAQHYVCVFVCVCVCVVSVYTRIKV